MTGDRAQCTVFLYNSERKVRVRANSFAEVGAVE
jgi:hypothetical protein